MIKKLRRTIPSILNMLVVVALTCSFPQAGADGADTGPLAAGGPLDGMVFTGRIGPAANPDLDDRLYFDNGQFWSGECVRCGFEPGIYWVRRTPDGIAFRGVLQSADRGTFSYDGMVRGTSIEVSINWRHERWYWTVNRDLRFVGELRQDENPGMTVEEAYNLAAGKPPWPQNCPS